MGNLHNLFFRYMQLLEQYLYILIECNGGMIASQLVKDGFGPSVLVETLVSPDDKVRCFSLSPKAYWTHSVACRKGMVFSRAENFYLELIRRHLMGK